MNIYLMHKSYYPNIGGMETSLYCLSKEMNEEGHEVTIVTAKTNKDMPERKEYAKIKYYENMSQRFFHKHKWLYPFENAATYMQLKNFFLNLKRPDGVIVRDQIMAYAYMKACPEVPLVYIPPVILRYNNRFWKTEKLRTTIKNLAYYFLNLQKQSYQEKVLKSCSKVVVFSENVKRQALSCRGVKDKNISVCYPGYDPKFERYNIDKKADGDIVEFLFVGRLVQDKNLSMLLKAFHMLNIDNWHLTIVGDGIERSALELEADKYHIQKHICFAGYRNDTENFYKRADYFVLPSVYEALGQVVLEALAGSVPVIGFSNNTGEVKTAVDELIEDGRTGFVCNIFSPKGLSAVLRKAIEYSVSDEYARMKENCFNTAKEKYSWKKFEEFCVEKLR